MAVSGRLRSCRVNEFEIGEVFSKIVKGLRHEMSGVIGEIERSRNLSLEEMKGMLRSSLEAVVCTVEKVMSGVSDELAGERNRREGEERNREERIRNIEERGGKEKKKRELEERRIEERLKRMEQKEKEREVNDQKMERRLDALEEQIEKERKDLVEEVGEMEERIQKLEEGDSTRERLEKGLRDESKKANIRQEIAEAKDSEKEMEKKVGSAMEKIKILDLDFGKVMEGREEIIKAATELIKENVRLYERKEWDWSMRRSRVYVLGKATKEKV